MAGTRASTPDTAPLFYIGCVTRQFLPWTHGVFHTTLCVRLHEMLLRVSRLLEYHKSFIKPLVGINIFRPQDFGGWGEQGETFKIARG